MTKLHPIFEQILAPFATQKAQNAQWAEFMRNLAEPSPPSDPMLPQAVELRRVLWASRFLTEDQKIDQLRSACIRMKGGVDAGKRLAADAVWATI